jgi:hypothetical protein
MFRKLNTGWIGFDIGDASVKTAQVVRRDGQFFIRTAAIVARRERWNPLELTAEQPRSSADEMQAAASICEGVAGRGKAAAVVLPMVLCDVALIDAPKSNGRGGDLRPLVEAELHQPLAGYAIGSWPAHLQAEKLNVVTVPGAWSDQISQDVGAGRWDCRIVDALPWALARAVGMVERPTAGRSVAALDWGYGRTTLCLVDNGAPAFVRCLKDCSFQSALTAVQESLRLTEFDAEKAIRNHGAAASTWEPGKGATSVIIDALAEPIQRLEREMRRTLGYWQGQGRGVHPERLYLFGGGASIAGLSETLSKALDLDARLWSLPAEVSPEADRLPPAHLLGPALAASALAWEDPWRTA